jgi:hypothetical protein
MAAVSRAVVCQVGGSRMTNKTNNSLATVANKPNLPPVRVKLRQVLANSAKVYPSDGEGKIWWKRLKKARSGVHCLCQGQSRQDQYGVSRQRDESARLR